MFRLFYALILGYFVTTSLLVGVSTLPFDILSKSNGSPGAASGLIFNGPSWTFSGNLNNNTKDQDNFTKFSTSTIFSENYRLPVSDAIHAWSVGTFTFSQTFHDPLVYLYRVPNSTQTLNFSFSDQNGPLTADRITILDGWLTDLGTSVRVDYNATLDGGGGVVRLSGAFDELSYSGPSLVGTDLAVVAIPEPVTTFFAGAIVLAVAWLRRAFGY